MRLHATRASWPGPASKKTSLDSPAIDIVKDTGAEAPVFTSWPARPRTVRSTIRSDSLQPHTPDTSVSCAVRSADPVPLQSAARTEALRPPLAVQSRPVPERRPWDATPETRRTVNAENSESVWKTLRPALVARPATAD